MFRATICRGTAVLSLVLMASLVEIADAESDFRVTLLGTGTPNPTADRFGPSTLVEVGNQKLVFDAGRGVPIRLWRLR